MEKVVYQQLGRTYHRNNLKSQINNKTPSKTKSLTIEILSIQLLNKLQHHSINRSLPQRVSGGETFRPSCFSVFVFFVDSIFELCDGFFDDFVIDRDTVEFCYDFESFFTFSDTEEVTTTERFNGVRK